MDYMVEKEQRTILQEKKMKKRVLVSLASVFLLLGMITCANASFLVEQYDDFWSTDVNALMNYADTHDASTSAYWNYIDFTDDPGGFAGEIPGSNPWPSAAAAGATGTGHALNQTFFAKITGDFYIGTAGTYTFRTFNDDGVFLYVDGILTINDPSQHPEYVFTGNQDLSVGMHSVELYFFENGGEASLEFSIGQDGVYTHFDDDDYQAPVPEPATMFLFGIGLLSLAGLGRRKR